MVTSTMRQMRLVDTPHGPITYTLTRKSIKNLNLRIGMGNEIMLSVPLRCSLKRADSFIQEKSGWITAVLSRRKERWTETLPSVSQEACACLLRQALERVYPLVEPFGVLFPALKLRTLKSQWGNCHWAKGYITLNTALARCPEELRDYVALHELVHFLHHDHGAGFYAQMDALMPDWQQRRRELKRYGAALENEIERSERT